MVPSDNLFYRQWWLRNTGQFNGVIGKDLHATAAWDRSTGGAPVDVVVLDTGIDSAHPDLAGRVVNGPNYVTAGPPYDDDVEISHGTSVSGMIAALGSGGGDVVGVDWTARVVAVKVCSGTGECQTSDVDAAVDWARVNGYRILNISLGDPNFLRTEEAIFKNAYLAGMAPFSAMGNYNCNCLDYPAGYSKFSIGVGAMMNNGDRWAHRGLGRIVRATCRGCVDRPPNQVACCSCFPNTRCTVRGRSTSVRSSLLVSVVCSLGWLVTGSVSGAGSLTYSIGAGRVGEGSDATGMASFGVSKLVSEHFEVAADVAYIHYQSSVSFTCVGGQCPKSDLETSFIPVSIGLIGYLRGPRQSGPYGEFSPSLYVNKWSLEGGAGSGRFTNLTAGLKLGLGARVAINEHAQLDLEMLYLLSGSGDIEDATIRSRTGEERFDGLKEVVPFARLSITL